MKGAKEDTDISLLPLSNIYIHSLTALVIGRGDFQVISITLLYHHAGQPEDYLGEYSA